MLGQNIFLQRTDYTVLILNRYGGLHEWCRPSSEFNLNLTTTVLDNYIIIFTVDDKAKLNNLNKWVLEPDSENTMNVLFCKVYPIKLLFGRVILISRVEPWLICTSHE